MCGVSKKPSVEKLWRGKANMQMSWSSPSAAFAQFRDQREGQLVGRMMLQRLATGATGVKQARYRLLGAARHSHAHAQYIRR